MLESGNVVWPAWKDQEELYQFRGYRLDSKGVPSFLYRFSKWKIEERLEPLERRGLRRQWKIQREENEDSKTTDESGVLNLCIHQAKKLKRQTTTQVTGDGLQARLAEMSEQDTGSGDSIIKMQESERWVVTLSGSDQQMIVVEYLW